MSELKIERVGRQGDGIARHNGQDVFIPFTLAGEMVEIDGKGKRLAARKILEKSEDRVEPICKHFGECGGCQLQHMAMPAYLEWKERLVRDALAGEGIEADVEPACHFSTASRRKAVFSACRIDGKLVLGFSEKASNNILDISSCPVLSHDLQSSLESIRDLAAALPLGVRPLRISALSTPNGCDLNLEGPLKLSPSQVTAITQKMKSLGMARLSLNGEILIEVKKPILNMGIAQLIPAPGGFVQAVLEAEEKMSSLVFDHLANCKTIADLFSGSGTFALRLAKHATVYAAEESDMALAALDRAWRETAGKLKQIETETRNLDRRPLSFKELKKFKGLVFDPPRAGAEMQCRQIAKSKVAKVAAVSCNPQTLARDLSILIEGGYQLKRVIPIDQFSFSPHVEVVALLER